MATRPTNPTRPTRAQKPGGSNSQHKAKQNSLPESGKTEKRPIPDPVEYLQSKAGVTVNGPQGHVTSDAAGHSNPMSPGASGTVGSSNTTKDSGAPQGFGGVPQKKEPQGNKAPVSGAGKKAASGLSPSNKKKAGAQAVGKPAFGLPSRNAMVRRQHPTFSGSGQSPNGSGLSNRSGILSKFEGFTPNPN
jgi:hypothetical protein